MLITKTIAVNNSIKGQNIPQNYSKKFPNIVINGVLSLNDVRNILNNSSFNCYFSSVKITNLNSSGKFLKKYQCKSFLIQEINKYFEFQTNYISQYNAWEFELIINTNMIINYLGLKPQGNLTKKETVLIKNCVKGMIRLNLDPNKIVVNLI